jgi:signal transduction histidine kinase
VKPAEDPQKNSSGSAGGSRGADPALVLDALGRFSAHLAHDYNNLLGVVIGNLRMLAERGFDDPERTGRRVELALRAATQAAELTTKLVPIAQREHLSTEIFEIDTWVSDLEAKIAEIVGPGISLRVSPGASGLRVLADRERLTEALMNLVDNARDALPDGGSLEVQTGRSAGSLARSGSKDWVTVTVIDSGCGMPASIVDLAFEPFFTTKPGKRGGGFGLSKVYSLARQLGGAVDLASVEGRGTTVRIHLPIA